MGSTGDKAGFVVVTGQSKVPRWFNTAWSFAFTERCPSAVLTALQHTTQFSSSLAPPFDVATRCSTLASPTGMTCPQKKQR